MLAYLPMTGEYFVMSAAACWLLCAMALLFVGWPVEGYV